MIYFRVEDADCPGLNGFHQTADGKIIEQTAPDHFVDAHVAKMFARKCQEQFPYSEVVAIQWEWEVKNNRPVTKEEKIVWRKENEN